LVGDDVGEHDPTVPAAEFERDLAVFEQPDERRPGDSEEVGGFLGGELRVVGSDRDRQALSHGIDHALEHLVDLVRERRLGPVRPDECSCWSLERGCQASQFGRILRRRQHCLRLQDRSHRHPPQDRRRSALA
jgi:hypothetical protein